ncbi:MAG: hypothetical protein WC782_13865 [Methylococcaceae bacterium]
MTKYNDRTSRNIRHSSLTDATYLLRDVNHIGLANSFALSYRVALLTRF